MSSDDAHARFSNHPSGQVKGFEDAGTENALAHAVLPEGGEVVLLVGMLPSGVVLFKGCNRIFQTRVRSCDLARHVTYLLPSDNPATRIIWTVHRLAARDPRMRSPEGVVCGSQDEVVPHCGRTEEGVERRVRGT